MYNPNEAILPDFTTVEYATAMARLIARDTWAEQAEIELRQAQEARQVAAEQEQEQQQALEDELIAVCKEEHKKNKAKFIPISTAKIPAIPTVIPSHYAVCKLKTGDYCELFYFTNKGLSEAKKNLLSTEPQGLILIPEADGQQMMRIYLGEEFNEATLRMITAMKQQEWPEDRINMHISFWTALQNHRWRHATDLLKQRALLLYQSQQRRMWHLTAGGPHGWSIAELNQELILEAREEIFNIDCDQALATLRQALDRRLTILTSPYKLPIHIHIWAEETAITQHSLR
ncbi:hypothetical protein C8R48DRAFT_668231 [Suillus tomentosus]|nr:hypothetical protein C8R48DRAFT_668231 [Suillus tomentosus]